MAIRSAVCDLSKESTLVWSLAKCLGGLFVPITIRYTLAGADTKKSVICYLYYRKFDNFVP